MCRTGAGVVGRGLIRARCHGGNRLLGLQLPTFALRTNRRLVLFSVTIIQPHSYLPSMVVQARLYSDSCPLERLICSAPTLPGHGTIHLPPFSNGSWINRTTRRRSLVTAEQPRSHELPPWSDHYHWALNCRWLNGQACRRLQMNLVII